MSEQKQIKIQEILSILEELDYLPGQDSLVTLVDYGKRKKILSIESKEFKDYLKFESLKRFECTASDAVIRDAISICRHNYKTENDTSMDFAIRVYYEKETNSLYYNLANSEMEYVVITAKGIKVEKFEFEKEHKFLFIMSDSEKAQVKPIRPKNTDVLRALDYLDDYLNLSEDEKFLYKIWMIASLYPDIKTPIPFFVGAAGTGKSSMVNILNDFIDPTTDTLKNWDSMSNRDLAIAFKYSWNYNVDNVSRIKTSQADLLCQTVTGGSMSFRRLFENDKQVDFELRRRVTLSTAKEIKIPVDLGQRMLFFYPKKIRHGTRISDDDFTSLYKEHKGEILYAIFSVLRCTLALFEDYKKENHTNYRLSSFYLFGELVAQILDAENGIERFQRIMKNQIREQLQWNTENDRKFYEVLLFFLEGSGNEYEGGIKELYECLYELITEDYNCPITDFNVIPIYDSFSKTIHIYEENMKMLGYELEFWQEGRNKTAMVRIRPEEIIN